ncbi:MAG TPA: exodeoxyribonuclease III [Candidatus Saccharimonadales bacterium]|nr:exodeoxyribonuclease III [Candidatus Saccharimonadales bacterium]
MRIYCWNVNGIRAVLRKGALQDFIAHEKPDILCMQETKISDDDIKGIDLELGKDNGGYHFYWNSASKRGYSGTAILSKIEPKQIICGFPDGFEKKYNFVDHKTADTANEGRVLTAEFENFWLVTVYTINAKDDLSRLPLKYKHWDPAFLAYVKQLEKTKPVVFCGDLNVAHTEDDLANPKPNVGKKGFTNEEREGFQKYIDAGFVDTFRMFKQGNGYYTWWSHFANARARNVGWRIDYFLASGALKDKIKAADIHPKYMGSDHCPISLDIEV